MSEELPLFTSSYRVLPGPDASCVSAQGFQTISDWHLGETSSRGGWLRGAQTTLQLGMMIPRGGSGIRPLFGVVCYVALLAFAKPFSREFELLCVLALFSRSR